MKRRAAAAAIVASITLVGCDNMANQPKQNPYETYSATVVPADRRPPEGTVAREDKPVPVPKVTLALLKRGQERFDIYCAPCHDRTGSGNGMIVQRGFPHPPSYHTDRLRQAPVRHFYDVITNGYGAMYPYAARVAPRDRWAIAAYIRALQASQDQKATVLSEAERQALR